jgi:DNA-binding YbaB/EbfC family protein
MLPNIPGLGNLQKQMQKMQDDMARLQTELENTRIDANSGGGMVKAVVNGKGEMLEIQIAPEVVDPNDVEMLQDLVTTAVRDAITKAEAHKTEKMNAVTGGVMGSLPKGLF